MTGNVLLRLLLALTAAGLMVWAYEERWFRNRVRSRYAPIFFPDFYLLFLPLFSSVPVLLAYIIKHPGYTGLLLRLGLVMELNLLLPVLGVTLLVLLLLPLLRKRISPEGCATLLALPFVLPFAWCLSLIFPTIRRNPWLILRIPGPLARVLTGIWIGGTLVALAWKLLSHLRFRRRLLKGAVPAAAWEQDLFRELREELCKQGPRDCADRLDIAPVHSPAASSPLTVGLLRRSTCLVLPVRDYTEEELRMVYRHEIIHLLRRDNALKLSITVLCALGWFIPSLWVGMGKTAEDLELCCDKLTTYEMDAPQRRRYAALLLSEAGTTQGFTTCLSASATGLRYRMQAILHPVLRENGAKVIALLTALFLFFAGTIAIGIGTGTVGTELLNQGWKPVGFISHETGKERVLPCRDTEALEACLRELEITEPTWDTSGNRYGFYRPLAQIRLENARGQSAELCILDNRIDWHDSSPGEPRYLQFIIFDASGDAEEETFYALSSPVDMERIQDCLAPSA